MQNMLVQNSSEKSAKKLFLYSHEYRDQKMREKKPRKNFFRNTRIVGVKNIGKKNRLKMCEKTFFTIIRMS